MELVLGRWNWHSWEWLRNTAIKIIIMIYFNLFYFYFILKSSPVVLLWNMSIWKWRFVLFPSLVVRSEVERRAGVAAQQYSRHTCGVETAQFGSKRWTNWPAAVRAPSLSHQHLQPSCIKRPTLYFLLKFSIVLYDQVYVTIKFLWEASLFVCGFCFLVLSAFSSWQHLTAGRHTHVHTQSVLENSKLKTKSNITWF